MAAPLKATFFAFRRRERGGVLLRATLVHVVLCVTLFVAWAAPQLEPPLQVYSPDAGEGAGGPYLT